MSRTWAFFFAATLIGSSAAAGPTFGRQELIAKLRHEGIEMQVPPDAEGSEEWVGGDSAIVIQTQGISIQVMIQDRSGVLARGITHARECRPLTLLKRASHRHPGAELKVLRKESDSQRTGVAYQLGDSPSDGAAVEMCVDRPALRCLAENLSDPSQLDAAWEICASATPID